MRKKLDSSTNLTAAGKKTKKAARLPPAVAAMSGELALALDEDPRHPVTGNEEALDLVTITPTMSKTDQLFACSWPWGKKVRRAPVGDRTRFGSAFHEVMEGKLHGRRPLLALAAATEWGVDPKELTERTDEALPVIKTWLAGENMWGGNFLAAGIKTEVAVAYNPKTDEARFCDGPTEPHHEYLDRKPGEIPGTADVVSIAELGPKRLRTLLVLDHKSGWRVAPNWAPQTPAENGQLRSLALALGRLHNATRVIVAFFHAPMGGVPTILADELTQVDLEAHRRNLAKAQARVGNGWLRPGEHCGHCPAWSICPTTTTSLVELKRSGGPLTAERVGAIHQATAEFDRLRDWLREEMRAWVSIHGPGVRPDGQLVDLTPRTKTNLSQASIVRALGPLKGGKMIAKLKSLGAIETKTNLELRAVKR